MQAFLSLCLGYFFGTLSPAALVSKLHHVNLKEEGTGNLGATNTILVIGKAAGFFVMSFDIAKSFLAYKLAKYLFPQLMSAGLLAGIGAILGHCFPVFLNFKGGKGLAAFGGLVLAHDPAAFVGLLLFGILMVLIVNFGVALTVSAATLFPVVEYFRSDDLIQVLLCAAASIFILYMHLGNIEKAKNDNDIHVRDYLKNVFFKRKEK